MAEQETLARAVSQELFGTDDVSTALSFVRITKPEGAEAGHVLIRLTMRPVHPYDLFLVRTSRLIDHVGKGRGVDVIPGCEGVGVVEEVGKGVKKFKKGDRVIPILLWTSLLGKGQGSWQDYIEMPEEDVELVPDNVPDEIAAQFVINPWTAYWLLKDLAVPHGGYLLQNAAGSVLGRLVIQLAKHWGVKTINIVRRDELKEELKGLGADEVINSTNEDVVAKVKEITEGLGAHGAIDMVGGSGTKILASSVKTGGEIIAIGALESEDITIGFYDLARGVQLKFWTLANIDEKRKRQVRRDVLKLLAYGVIVPLVGKKFPLERFLDAISESEKNSRGGKVQLV